jgi:hypothetical protein
MDEQQPTSGAILAAYRDWHRGSTGGQAAQHAVRDFLNQHWQAARAADWSDLDLFGCHPDLEFAPVRWDCMGAVTLAAATGVPVTEIHPDLIRYANRTAYRRKDLTHAVPIWMRP